MNNASPPVPHVKCPKCGSDYVRVTPGALPDFRGVEMECRDCDWRWDRPQESRP